MGKDVLHPITHARLLEDIHGVSAKANIPIEALHTSAKTVLKPLEIEWMLSLDMRPSGLRGRGLMLVGGDAEDKLIAICAALIRNFVDARIVSLNSLLDGHSTTPNPSVLIVPNLYVKAIGNVLPSWKVQQLYDTLMSRKAAGQLTVGYIEDLSSLKKDYGAVFERHIKNNYEIIQG